MEVDNNNEKIILHSKDDFEFIKMILHIRRVKYGEIKVKLKEGRPYLVTETKRNILLTKDSLKDSDSYGG